VKRLMDLQTAEGALARARKRIAELTNEEAIRAHAARLDELRAKVRALHAAAEAAEKELKRLIDEREAATEKRRRENDRLYSGAVTNPKELQAIQAEIDQLDRRVVDLEEKIGMQRTRVEELRGRVAKADGILAEYEAEVSRQEEGRGAEVARLEVETERLERDIARLREELPAEALKLYDRLKARFGEETVVSLAGDACGGCYVGIDDEVLQAVRREPERVHQCPNCGRIIVVG
jgi:predicted  nucleic acid-binding Zn-ribbon protein